MFLKTRFVCALSCLFTLLISLHAQAWGRRGHSIVNSTAAYLLADQSKDPDFFRSHSFDLGFYANIPDNLWKVPALYGREHPEHYTDLNVFEAAFKKEGKGAGIGQTDDPFRLSRKEFETRFSSVSLESGRSFWRIRELDEALIEMQAKLKSTPGASPLSQPAIFNLQAKWLLFAGVMGHYIGDLGQPLHVTDNFDGQASHQLGIHSFFEDKMVDALYPELAASVLENARRAQKDFHKKHGDDSLVTLLEWLAQDSERQISTLLTHDKEIGRDNLEKAARVNRELIVRQMTQSSLVLAEIWRRAAAGWTPDNTRFYIFLHAPAYIEPGQKDGRTTSDIKNDELLNEFSHR